MVYLQISRRSHYGDPLATSNRYLEKIAIDWGSVGDWAAHHAAIGGAVHVAQNAGTELMIKHVPAYRNAFRDYFHAGLQGKGLPSKANIPKKVSAFSNEIEFAPRELGQEATHLAHTPHDASYVAHNGSFVESLAGAVSPELKMILEEAHAAGTHARHGMLEQAKKRQLEVDARVNQKLQSRPHTNGLSIDTSKTVEHQRALLDQGATVDQFTGHNPLNSNRETISRRMDAELAPGYAISEKATDKIKSTTSAGLDTTEGIQRAIGKKSLVIYARALRGDFVHLHDMAKLHPQMHDVIHSHLQQIERKTHHPLTSILGSREVAQRVETAYKDNPITGKLFTSLADKPRDVSGATDNLHTRSKSLLTGALASGAADPLAGLMNTAKVVMSDKTVLADNPGLKSFSDKIAKKVVTGPIAQAADTGLVQAKRHNTWYQRAKKYLANNAVGNFEDAVNSTAYAAGQHTRGIRKALAVGEDVQ